MSLDTYRKKRDFTKTPEPSPSGSSEAAPTGRLSFVVQKHAASRLHYDFRLEWAGALKSWAVPKGPSLDPADRRLAVHVEDHPLDYGEFEGVIPAGQYGGGTVVLWDRGEWLPAGDDPGRDLERGKLDFELRGEKLRGRWRLVRMGGAAGREEADNWLLLKRTDQEAAPGSGERWVDERPESVATGRTLEEIARAPDRIWDSATGERPARSSPDPSDISAAREAPLPEAVEPALARPVDEAPAGDGWLHEIKHDGYRLLARIDAGEARLTTRRGHDWTDRFPTLAGALAGLPVEEALLDGEAVALRDDGRSDFGLLQEALSTGRSEPLLFYAFDLLHLDGWSLLGSPLEERKGLLAKLFEGVTDPLRLSDHVAGQGPGFHRQACRFGLEGIVSKRRTSSYRSGRGSDWLKTKCISRQELVIGGYTDPSGSRQGLGALLVGVYDGDGTLRYASKVGTGFTAQSLEELARRLAPLERSEPPFVDPPRGAAARGAHWVEPELVAEIAFTEWTRDGSLRHPSFQGLREDKDPRQVVREEPAQHAIQAGEKTDEEIETMAQAKPSGTDGKQKRATGSRRAKAASPGRPIEVEGVRLTSPDKVLYPEQGVTKRDLADYYRSVADWILPHLAGRPLSLVRCPEGADSECFYQKHLSGTFPAALGSVEIEEKDGDVRTYVTVDDLPGLLGLVQIGVLEIHVWGSRRDRIERPDRMVLDLDPGEGVPWVRVIEAAYDCRNLLAELGLESFVKTTGGKGLHVVVPLVRTAEFDDVKAFARAVADEAVRRKSDRYLANMSKAKRKGKIFIDYLRNGRGATFVAPYSTRARPGAPVSVPIGWDELSPDLRSDAFDVTNLPRRLAGLGADPWARIGAVRQQITKAMRRAVGLSG